jgi:hypothetical protein
MSEKRKQHKIDKNYIPDESIHYLAPDKYPMTDDRFYRTEYDIFTQKLPTGPEATTKFLQTINKENEILNKRGGSIKRKHRSNKKRKSNKRKSKRNRHTKK